MNKSHELKSGNDRTFRTVAKALAACTALSLALAAQADTYNDGKYTWNFREVNGGVEICQGEGSRETVTPTPSGTLKIPAIIAGKPVVSIGNNVFMNHATLTGVTIPDTVKDIGEYAFYGCGNLTDLHIPYGVTNIRAMAFAFCISLPKVNIPDSVKVLGSDVFLACRKLENVVLSASLEEIPESAFYGAGHAMKVTIPQGVKKINIAAFSETDIKYLYIPSSVTSIVSRSFYNSTVCNSDQYSDPPVIYVDKNDEARVKDMLKYEGSAFRAVKEVTTGTWKDPQTGIVWSWLLRNGEVEIYGGKKISAISATTKDSITVPEYVTNGMKVTRIGDYAFYHCNKLDSVEIPEGITSIGRNAFEGCTALTEVDIPTSVTEIGDGAFFKCKKLADSETGCVIIRGVLYGYFGTKTKLSLPSEVTRIGREAFSGGKKIKQLYINSVISDIGEQVFKDCSNLAKISVPYGLKQYVRDLLTNSGNSLSGIEFSENAQTLFIVKFNAKGGKSEFDMIGRKKNKTVGTLPKATKQYNTFNGWYTKSSDGTKITKSTKVTKNVTYYAQWTPYKYTIEFDANGGKGNMDLQTASYGKAVTLLANKFTRKDCTFRGWTTNFQSKVVVYKDKASVKNLSKNNNGNVILYAVWKIPTYSVNFDKNGGKGKMNSQSIECNEYAKLKMNAFTREGFVFAGWSKKPDGTVDYKNKSEVKDLAKKDQSITLYAVWKPAAWAVGTYTGVDTINLYGNQDMSFTFTVASDGKLSGKFIRHSDSKSFSFKADRFEKYSTKKQALVATTTMKYGKKKVLDVEIEVFDRGDGDAGVIVNVESGGSSCGYAVGSTHRQ